MGITPNKTKKRLLLAFSIICVLAVILCFRVGWQQIVRGAEYSKLAVEQQTRDVPIDAKRGSIVDRNGKELAISAVSYTLWARPANVKSGNNDEQKQMNYNNTVQKLSEILGMSKEELETSLTKQQALVKVAKYLDKETANAIRQEKLPGIELSEDVKRYYPHGAFAAHLLGSVTDDNNGLAGLELKYNQFLSGIAGRWIKNTDVIGQDLSYGVEKYYQAEDGLTVVSTIDEVIQHYVEKSIEVVQQNTQADRVMCIIMEPKTGYILSMAVTPEYDPNNPRTPLDPTEAAYVDSLDDSQKIDYWNKMWRNPLVSDIYEPGSTFKLLTTAMALEEKVTNLQDGFVCTGSYKVATETLHCWRRGNPHGAENLIEAVGNSCNPVFIQLAQRLGEDTYYKYLELFGLYDKTGIDYPGEGRAILQKKETAGPVGLATMSYGQGIAVTPIQLITAVSAMGNGGKLMQPKVVKALLDSEGNTVEEFTPVVVRQILSQETTEEMCSIMEYVVEKGGGGTAKVPGYRVGGKTGTANKASGGGYSEETYSSFIGMAPMDDPQVAILLIVDNPKGTKFGSQTAAPGVKMILEDTLRYLNVKPEYTEDEIKSLNSGSVTVPHVIGENFSEAIGILGGEELTYIVSPQDTPEDEDFIVVDQYPKSGTLVDKGTAVYVYSR